MSNIVTIPHQQADSRTGTPTWLSTDEKGRFVIDEPAFVRSFINSHGLSYIGGDFYDKNGFKRNEDVRQEIYRYVEPFVTKNIARTATGLYEAIKMAATTECARPDETKIFVSGGYMLEFDLTTGEFACKPDRGAATLHRFCVNYDPAATCPRFVSYMEGLFYPEDIPAIQEYIGYCLIPSTRGQTALFIEGSGGIGKSVLTNVLSALFGRSKIPCKINSLEENRFAASTLEHRLLAIDDDMKNAAIEDTGSLKELISLRSSVLVERKGVQPHEAHLYARIIGIGNEQLRAASDTSDGFYRRLMLVTCKPRAATFKADRFFSDGLMKEMSGIFNWAIIGLQRLMRNGFNFSVSQRMVSATDDKRSREDPFYQYAAESGWLERDANHSVTSSALYANFNKWHLQEYGFPCELARKAACDRLVKTIQTQFGATRDTNIRINGVRHSGYKGIALTDAQNYF